MGVGPDLGEDGVLCDPVGADYHLVDLPLAHDHPGHAVADEGDGNVVFRELPGGEPRPLMERPRLAGVDADLFALGNGRPDDPQSRPPIDAGEPPGVAVGEDDVPVFQQAGSDFAEGFVDRNVLPGYQFRLRQGRGPDLVGVGGFFDLVDGLYGPVDAPGEVDGRRPRRPDDPRRLSDVIEEGGGVCCPGSGRRQGDAVGPGGAEGGSAPDPQGLDRLA